MKKIIFTIYFSLFTIICSAQNYEWQPIIPGLDCSDSVYAKCRIGILVNDTFHNTLWCIGRFQGGGGIQSERAVGFNGINWLAFPGVYDSVLVSKTICAIMYNGNLVIGKTDGVEMFNFTTNLWENLGGANDDVLCLGIYNGELIAAGRFFTIGGIFANRIAKWNGVQWDTLSPPSVSPAARESAWRDTEDYFAQSLLVLHNGS